MKEASFRRGPTPFETIAPLSVAATAGQNHLYGEEYTNTGTDVARINFVFRSAYSHLRKSLCIMEKMGLNLGLYRCILSAVVPSPQLTTICFKFLYSPAVLDHRIFSGSRMLQVAQNSHPSILPQFYNRQHNGQMLPGYLCFWIQLFRSPLRIGRCWSLARYLAREGYGQSIRGAGNRKDVLQ